MQKIKNLISLGYFYNGVAQFAVQTEKGERYGLINADGEIITPARYEGPLLTLGNGMWVFGEVDVNGNFSSGIIDRYNRVVVPGGIYRSIVVFAADLLIVRDTHSGKKGLINLRGESVVACEYDFIYRDENDTLLPLCHDAKLRTSLLYTPFTEIMQTPFDSVWHFKGGKYTTFCSKYFNTWRMGLIDRKGNIVIEPKYKYLFAYDGGDNLLVAHKGNRSAVITPQE